MPKISADELAKKLQSIYRTKKRDPEKIGTGDQIPMPKFYVSAPEVIKRLIGIDYPLRRIIQIAGKPNSGKTTLAMLAMAAAQKQGFYTILCDTEKKFSNLRFEKMGGNPSELNTIFATTLEEGFLGINEYLNLILGQEPEAKIFIVFDSLGGTPSRAEMEADADETIQLATAAKVIKRELRKFVQIFDKHDIGLMLVNQNYANIGGHGRSNSGGDGAEYYSSIILQLGRIKNIIKQVKGEKVICGITTRANVTKNHLMQSDTTLKEVDFNIYAYNIEDAANVSNSEDDE